MAVDYSSMRKVSLLLTDLESGNFMRMSILQWISNTINFTFSGKNFQYIVFRLYEVIGTKRQLPAKYWASRIERGGQRASVTFSLVKMNAKYEMDYHALPYFSDAPIGSGSYFLESTNVAKILSFYSKPENNNNQISLVGLKTKGESEHVFDPNDVVIYFKIQRNYQIV